jgi:hypothetical protein
MNLDPGCAKSNGSERVRIWNIAFKNSVTIFFVSGFFFKLLLMVRIGTSRNDFEFFRIFVELFVFVIDSPVMDTPGSRLVSLDEGIFF